MVMSSIATRGWVPNRERIAAAVFTVMVEALLLYALLVGLRVVPYVPVEDAMKVINVAVPPPPRPEPPPPRPAEVKQRTKEKEGAASPKNIRSKATPVVAPKPVIPPPRRPIEATLKADFGRISTSGASDVRGPGTGSGGFGEGTGSGRGGYGPGGGGGRSPPIHISGRLRDADYPRAALDALEGGTVTVVVTIEPNGRVSQCDVVRSSGSYALDDTTCRLIQQRYRYRPARDDYGRPVRSREMSNHSWVPRPWDG